MSAALPPGWTSQFDHQSQRYFYIEIATGRREWEHPSRFVAMGGAYPPPYPQQVSPYGAPQPVYGAPVAPYGSPYGVPQYGMQAPTTVIVEEGRHHHHHHHRYDNEIIIQEQVIVPQPQYVMAPQVVEVDVIRPHHHHHHHHDVNIEFF